MESKLSNKLELSQAEADAIDVEFAVNGDTQAFERLYRRHVAKIHCLAPDVYSYNPQYFCEKAHADKDWKQLLDFVAQERCMLPIMMHEWPITLLINNCSIFRFAEFIGRHREFLSGIVEMAFIPIDNSDNRGSPSYDVSPVIIPVNRNDK